MAFPLDNRSLTLFHLTGCAYELNRRSAALLQPDMNGTYGSSPALVTADSPTDRKRSDSRSARKYAVDELELLLFPSVARDTPGTLL
jgi:hypothetical protein